jgi:hypothetical protein
MCWKVMAASLATKRSVWRIPRHLLQVRLAALHAPSLHEAHAGSEVSGWKRHAADSTELLRLQRPRRLRKLRRLRCSLPPVLLFVGLHALIEQKQAHMHTCRHAAS